MRNHTRTLATTGLLLGLATTHPAAAQDSLAAGGTPPNVLLLLDSSSSMKWDLNGNSGAYAAGAGNKSRWAILAEVLTGSVNGLYVNSSIALGSRPGISGTNRCLPQENTDTLIVAALGAGGPSGAMSPYGWPQAIVAQPNPDPIAFANYTSTGTFSGWCTEAAGGTGFWSQQNDGIIDAYQDRVRFGVSTFDHPTHSNGWIRGSIVGGNLQGTPQGCTLFSDGSFCGGHPEWSYWYESSSDNWLLGGPHNYNGRFMPTFFDNARQDEILVDVGMQNPRALPWKGRLVGFGPSEWPVGTPGLPCTSATSCMIAHNNMVQRTVLGRSDNLEGYTPLAAMLRDAHEFMVNDTGSVGVHVPHRRDVDLRVTPSLSGTIGPQTDPAVIGGCRKNAVILVTDGEPTGDIDANMSDYAALLAAEEIPVFVLAIGVPSARWSPTGSSADSRTTMCSTLTDADRQTGGMCERSSDPRRFRFADEVVASDTQVDAVRVCCNLLETAVLGGTERPFFPTNQTQLRQQLDAVLLRLAGGSISRSAPVFAGTTASFVANANSNAPATSYEIRTSLEFSEQNSLWRGNLERVRYACDNTSNPVVQDVDPTLGDRFHENVNQNDFTRRIFTVVPRLGAASLRGILRPSQMPVGAGTEDVAALDGAAVSGAGAEFRRLGILPDSLTGEDALSRVDRFSADINATGQLAASLLGLPFSSFCTNVTGAADASECADRVLRWFGGEQIPGDITPSRQMGSPRCVGDECSNFGGIYHSTPIVIPPPQAGDSDDQNYSRDRPGANSFVETYGLRPTMLYSQTVDGQLHAFLLSKNDARPGNDPNVLPLLFNDGLPDADRLANNELWTFVPPAVLPDLVGHFNAHGRLLDGQMAWSNVVFSRASGSGAADADNANWDYRTVLVGSSGLSASGAFYYAVDVTDPRTPKFLWQIGTAGLGPNGEAFGRLFGASAPGAAITHIRLRETLPGAGEVERILAVAILPGGSPLVDIPPTTIRTRRGIDQQRAYWPTGVVRQPRELIRDWGATVQSRSLTVVELATGRIIARMVGNDCGDGDSTGDDRNGGDTPIVGPNGNGNGLGLGCLAESNNVTLSDTVRLRPLQTPFDSPITGIPIAFPAGVGAVADRIYVGDADGTMWRVELTPNRDEWRAQIAYDAYSIGTDGTLMNAWVEDGGPADRLGMDPTPEEAALMGQPIQGSQVLSTDAQGNVVLTLATGDLENFAFAAPNVVNIAASVVDRFDASPGAPSRYQVDVTAQSGVEMAFTNGSRITGPITLFDGKLFFATFEPGNANACSSGTAAICGVDYLRKDPDGSPVELIDLGGDSQLDECVELPNGELVFGVAVSQIPSCVAAPDNFADPWLAGNYSATTQSNTGQFQLSFQTGSSGESQNNSMTNTATFQLPTPSAQTRVQTWVSVSE